MNLSPTAVGLLAGLLLGVAAAAGGFIGFLVAVVLGVAGLVIGGQIEGRFDIVDSLRGRRRD